MGLHGLRRVAASFAGALVVLGLAASARAATIDEFSVGVKPGGITTGPDGALWFTEEGPPSLPLSGAIGRLTTGGAYTHFEVPGMGNVPDQITTGPDGALWFTQVGANQIGRIDTAGNITEFSNAGGSPQGITSGPGGLWYTAAGSNTIRQIATDGTPGAVYPIPTPASNPSDIIVGPDGRLWFTEEDVFANKIGALNPNIPPAPYGSPQPAITEYQASPGSEPSSIIATTGAIMWFAEPGIDAIGRITTGGTITEFPGAGAFASGIAAGQDGALWYTLGYGGTNQPCAGTGEHSIGRITTAGSYTNKYPTRTPNSDPADITQGPDGALWFTEFCGNKVGRITAEAGPPAPPTLLAVGHSARALTANWMLAPGTASDFIEAATSPATYPDGFFLDETTKLFEDLAPTQTTYQSRAQLPPGTYYVHVGAYDPSQCTVAWCLNSFSDVVQVTIPPDAAPAPPPPDKITAFSALRVASRQRIDNLVVHATMPENGTITVAGTVNVPNASKVFKLKPISVRAIKGKALKVKVELPKKALKTIKKAIRRGKRIKANLTITARDTAGNKKVEKRSVRLKR